MQVRKLTCVGTLEVKDPTQTTSTKLEDYLRSLLRAEGNRLRVAAVRYVEAPTGQLTPVPTIEQYPFGCLARYCWW